MKLKRIILSMLLMLLFVPCTMLFAACGATPTNEARSVRFISNVDLYENGKAIFELDYEVETHLDFEITPSSWSGYEPTYRIRSGGYGDNLNSFRLNKNGSVYIIKPDPNDPEKKNIPDFQTIEVEIIVHGFSDTCEVRLKEYPTEIYVENTDVTINAGDVYQIKPLAKFKDKNGNITSDVKITEDRYNFVVETSNPTLIVIDNPSILKVRATQKISNEVVIVNVHILDQLGNRIDNLKITLKFTITQTAKTGYLDIGEKLIFDDETEPVLLMANDFSVLDGYEIHYVFNLISDNGIKIEDFYYEIYCENADCSTPGVIKFQRPSVAVELPIKITILTKLNTSEYKAYTYVANLLIRFN